MQDKLAPLLKIFIIAYVAVYALSTSVYLAKAGSPNAPAEQTSEKEWEPLALFDKNTHLEYNVVTGMHEVHVSFDVKKQDQGLAVKSFSNIKRKTVDSASTRINWGGPRSVIEEFTVDSSLKPLTASYNSALWNMHYWILNQGWFSNSPLKEGSHLTGSDSSEIVKALEVTRSSSMGGLTVYIIKAELINGMKVQVWVGKEVPAVLKYVEYNDKGEIAIESTLVSPLYT